MGRDTREPVYLLGVFPHLPPRELEKVFSPMAADLGEAMGRRVVLRSNTTYERFAQNLDREVFDIAFVQPFDYVRAADRFGYLPVATRGQRLSAILVTTEGGSISSLDSLRGKTIALPPRVAAVSHLVKAHLAEHGLEIGKDVFLSFHRSHVSCMQQVLISRVAACGTAAPALRFFEHKMGVQLETVSETRKIPHTLFIVHPRVPPLERKLLKQRILGWGQSPRGRALLARGRLKPFVPITDAAYDVVRSMSAQRAQ